MKNPTWADLVAGGTRIDAADLNNMEDGIYNATFGRSTTFPSTPVDGQLHQYPASASLGVMWLFVYNSGSASAHKWECVSGPPLYAEVETSQTTTSASYVDLATVGPSITVPKAGDYLITCHADTTHSTTHQCWISPKIGAATALDADGVAYHAWAASAIGALMTQRVKTLAASDVIKIQYRTSAATATFLKRRLFITPIRVTP